MGCKKHSSWSNNCLDFQARLWYDVVLGRRVKTHGKKKSKRRRQHNLGGKYILMADIDLSGISNWVPVGTASAPFTGQLDGNGYKLPLYFI